ncbi:MAG TPA: NapC/NirT family cytochrome c, partial [Bacteroidales bacterium]|nr:NapC/NirT family cytochrome c [Bacteroidales bacterium]
MKLPKSFYNWTSLIGATIALISLFMIIFLFIISLIYRESGSYLGLVIYIVLPVFLVLGLIIIPIGMIRKHRKDKRGEVSRVRRWPIFDFNEQRTRNGFSLFAIGTTLFLLLSAMGSYEAFHYTESVKFCGTLCHRVMKPEYVAYQNSAHARVACVDCHVGTGANWYVRSKLSGLYQVYATLLNIYPRPIPTPIKNLRPARETCEECHWPEKFYAHQLVKKVHYLADGSNTEWTMNLMLKIGPEHSSLGLLEGIHWHINPEVTIEY